jgi:hypothetical protein
MNIKLAGVLSGLCFAAAVAMYFIGKDSSHLSELKDFFWVPIPLGIIALVLYYKNRKL